jgi:hypothetical protein
MPSWWQDAVTFTQTVGYPVMSALALAYALVRRRRKNGKELSPLLVPGWVHDDLIEELATVRSAWAARLLEERNRSDERAKEYRQLIDELQQQLRRKRRSASEAQ